jgi:hypothetical protein
MDAQFAMNQSLKKKSDDFLTKKVKNSYSNSISNGMGDKVLISIYQNTMLG